MDDLTDILNMILAALALAAVLWGFRQRSLLRRLQSGLVALRQGRRDHRLRRDPEDHEPVLEAFDTFAEQLQSAEKSSPPADGQSLSNILTGICDTLRPPLVAIQSYASLLGQEPNLTKDPLQREYLENLNLQVNGLMRLLASSADLSELRQGLSGLRRDIVRSISSLTGETLLLLDSEGALSSFVAPLAAGLGMKLLVAPGEDAALIMARAIDPVAILVNAARPDRLGWRALGAILRQENAQRPPIVLLAMTEDRLAGKIWVAREFLDLPLPDFRRQWLLENRGEPTWNASGDEAIYQELHSIVGELQYHGTSEGLPQGMLAIRKGPWSPPDPMVDLLAFRRSDLLAHESPLIQQFCDMRAHDVIAGDAIAAQLTEVLSRLSDRTSITKTENKTLAT